jgi:protein-S-isoprenylcysteine O-methyltransferase Ste14
MVTNRSETDLAIRRRRAAIGSALFMAVGPGTVAGLVPYLLTGWRPRRPVPGILVRAAGSVLIGAGGTMITSAFVRFVREGLGTPVPMAPPTELVVGGVYRAPLGRDLIGIIAISRVAELKRSALPPSPSQRPV